MYEFLDRLVNIALPREILEALQKVLTEKKLFSWFERTNCFYRNWLW